MFQNNNLRCLTNPEDHEICSEDECHFGSGHYDLIPDTDDESIVSDYFPGLIFLNFQSVKNIITIMPFTPEFEAYSFYVLTSFTKIDIENNYQGCDRSQPKNRTFPFMCTLQPHLQHIQYLQLQ